MHHHCLDEDWFADIWRRLTVVSAVIDDLLLGSGGTLHNYTDFDNGNGTGINQDKCQIIITYACAWYFLQNLAETKTNGEDSLSAPKGPRRGSCSTKPKGERAGTCCLGYLDQF